MWQRGRPGRVSFIQSNYILASSCPNRYQGKTGGHGFSLAQVTCGTRSDLLASVPHLIIPAFAMHADGTPQMAFGVMWG
jgi:gamma-glutamyltranspeptidase/glutathione hydrolase